MSFGRAVIIPAILALGAAGSILAGSAVPAAAALSPASHIQSPTTFMKPGLYYHA